MAGKSILRDRPEVLVGQFYQALLAKKIPIEKLILFGSYAKGKPKPWSDLDICVVSKQFGKDPFEELVYLKQIASSVEAMIEPHPLHPREFKDNWNLLAQEIRKYGKVWPKPKTANRL